MLLLYMQHTHVQRSSQVGSHLLATTDTPVGRRPIRTDDRAEQTPHTRTQALHAVPRVQRQSVLTAFDSQMNHTRLQAHDLPQQRLGGETTLEMSVIHIAACSAAAQVPTCNNLWVQLGRLDTKSCNSRTPTPRPASAPKPATANAARLQLVNNTALRSAHHAPQTRPT